MLVLTIISSEGWGGAGGGGVGGGERSGAGETFMQSMIPRWSDWYEQCTLYIVLRNKKKIELFLKLA